MSFAGFFGVVSIILILRWLFLNYTRKYFAVFSQRPVPDEYPVFPRDFKFGVSTAAYQIEADVPPSNWMLWEQQADQMGVPRAPVDPMKCDGFNRFFEDAKLAQKMGTNMYRLSFCWSRLNPRPGEFDSEVLAVYRSWLIRLREMGMEPLLVLWHFEHPAWLEKAGSFHGKEFVARYEEYVEFVMRGVHDVCDYYHTVNEPIGYVAASLLSDMHPPGKGSVRDIMNGLVNLAKSHAVGYNIIHRFCATAKVSFAHAIVPFVPMHKWSVLEAALAYFMNMSTKIFMDVFTTGKISFLWMSEEIPGIVGALDYISINHYYVTFVTLNWRDWLHLNNTNRYQPFFSYGTSFLPVNDFGWGMMPASLAGAVKWLHDKFNKGKLDLPIIVTEHGAADALDTRRQWFLRESLWHLSMLVKEGYPIIGYTHWSLTDNYEWSEGSTMKFGLVEIDFATQERKPRRSSEIYAAIIKESRDQ